MVDPGDHPDVTRVFFGATVAIEDEDGNAARYTIVGQDEIDTARGHISYKSPLARALLKRRAGETILFRKPAGEVELTIVSIAYG